MTTVQRHFDQPWVNQNRYMLIVRLSLTFVVRLFPAEANRLVKA